MKGSNMGFDFTGRKVLVTGVTKGIGRLLATSLVQCGAEVYGIGRNPDELSSLVNECGAMTFHPLRLDLTDWKATRAAVEQLPPMYGLVNNAGVSYDWVSSLSVTKEVVDKTFAVNVSAALNITQVVGKKMVDAGNGGAIVNVSSINGLTPMKDSLAYNMSKAALDMMTKQFALELGPHRIRVNSVNPIATLSQMTIEFLSMPGKSDTLRGHTPLGRFAEVQECVDPILYLLSDHFSMVTGTMNRIDGGLLANISV